MTEHNPLLSVIVPVYNVEKYLRRCVDSILAQTYTNLEIILIDEGTLRAHHPYFIRAKNKAAENMHLSVFDAKVLSTTAAEHTVINTSSAYLNFTLTGTYDTMVSADFDAIGGKNYAISTNGGWYRTKGLKPFRVYLTIKERPGSPVKVDAQNARVRMRVAGEETTSIGEVEMTVSDQPTIVYDLQGRRVLNTEGLKGIYIVNGKKVAF
jgi:cellulose synthase/poly-beta-1,6-N-acetylglucosamine synthase-like glycosyltransferase